MMWNYDRLTIVVTLEAKLYFYFFSWKLWKLKKEAGTNFVLLSESRNAIGWFKKTCMYRPNAQDFKNVNIT